MVDERIGLMTNWGDGPGAKMQADRRTWMINANFVNQWARVYELRARTAFPTIGDTYDQLLPKGVRHTSLSGWDVEFSLINGLAGRASFGRDEFLEVCYWKSSRSIVTASKNTSRQIHSATARAFALLPSDPQGGARALLALDGVGVPVASALLAIARPAEATVLDIRALQTLYWNGELMSPDPVWAAILNARPPVPSKPTKMAMRVYRRDVDQWWNRVRTYWYIYYDEYVWISAAIVGRLGGAPLTLRELDRALWAAGGATEAP